MTVYCIDVLSSSSLFAILTQKIGLHVTLLANLARKSNVDCKYFRFRLVHYSYLRLRRVMMAWLCRMGTYVHMAVQMKLYLSPDKICI